MKKTVTLVLLVLAVSAASAQIKGRGFFYSPGATVVVGGFYPSLMFGPYYLGYPYYGYGPTYRPSKLDIQIMDIKHDFEDRISSVKLDNSLSGKERRQKIRELKKERDDAVDAAKRNYYKS